MCRNVFHQWPIIIINTLDSACISLQKGLKSMWWTIQDRCITLKATKHTTITRDEFQSLSTSYATSMKASAVFHRYFQFQICIHVPRIGLRLSTPYIKRCKIPSEMKPSEYAYMSAHQCFACFSFYWFYPYFHIKKKKKIMQTTAKGYIGERSGKEEKNNNTYKFGARATTSQGQQSWNTVFQHHIKSASRKKKVKRMYITWGKKTPAALNSNTNRR